MSVQAVLLDIPEQPDPGLLSVVPPGRGAGELNAFCA